MNKFLFITHITPKAKRSGLRQDLIDIYYKGLLSQTYAHWKVLILGEGNVVDERFTVVPLIDGTKEEKFADKKIIYNSEHVVALVNEADYIVKLDDDDVISPTILDHLKNFQGDMYCDRNHCFYNLAGGQITNQKRNWMASTCVHKREHAFAPWTGEGSSVDGTVLYSEHSKAWQAYYADKKVVIADPKHPVYMRVLSPTSITAGARNKKVNKVGDVDWNGYQTYLSGFGNWQDPSICDFDEYLDSLKQAWRNFGGTIKPYFPAKRKRFLFW